MEYLTLKQAAQVSDTSYATLRRDIDNGILPAYKVGRKYFVTAADAAAYGEQRRAVAEIDGYTIRQIMEILHKVNNGGTTIMMITHNLQWLEEFPGRVFKCEDRHLTVDGE